MIVRSSQLLDDDSWRDDGIDDEIVRWLISNRPGIFHSELKIIRILEDILNKNLNKEWVTVVWWTSEPGDPRAISPPLLG
jgi:hypothetical protein